MSGKDKVPTLLEFWERPKKKAVIYLSGIYEHSSWVAETLFDEITDGENYTEAKDELKIVRDLFKAMSKIVDASSLENKLELLRAHPDLCAKIETMKTLTKESQIEQSSAGLDTLTDDERTQFYNFNTEYRDKFGFPFILAARNATKYTVLSAIEGRLQLGYDSEMAGAIYQVHKIAWMRLLAAFKITEPKGFLTCHVLDTAHGCPAANMRIQLRRLTPLDKAGLISEFFTNEDGRLPGGPALKNEEFIVGTYEWLFFVDDYFAMKNTKTSGVPFLNEVPLRFGIDDPDEHYHVPLLVSPWSLSTYRGS